GVEESGLVALDELAVFGREETLQIPAFEQAAEQHLTPRLADGGFTIVLDVPRPDVADPVTRRITGFRLERRDGLPDRVGDTGAGHVAVHDAVGRRHGRAQHLRLVGAGVYERRRLPLAEARPVAPHPVELALVVHRLAGREPAAHEFDRLAYGPHPLHGLDA